MENKLFRSKNERIIAGVCGGLAEHYKIDPIAVRVSFVILAFFNGIGIALYIILAILIPETEITKSEELHELNREKRHNNFGNLRDIFAVVLILVGVISFAQQIFPNFWISMKLVYSLVIIGLGIYLIVKE